MPQPQKPDRRLQQSENFRQEAAASRETSRPADSVPMVSGSFAHLPARFGRYQVEKLLGRGAMGAVYLARDTQLDRRVALKIPKVSASGSQRLLQRLKTEAQAAAQLDHPHLCKVYDAGEVEGQCFIAMQYIEGETLKARLESTEISTSDAVALILHLAEGLSEAHERGIVHRDLKPENIMINRRGMPVIMDFGLAKFSNISDNAKATQAGTILGSPAYMSPEQASGRTQEIDERSDIYSLGVILFELLTGALPFTGTSMVVMGQKSILDPQSPLSLNADLPPQLSGICHKMIAKSNTERYQSLQEVISDLRSLTSFIPQPEGLQPYSLDAQAYSVEGSEDRVESQTPLPRLLKRKRTAFPSKQSSRPFLYGGLAAGLILLLGIVLWFRDGDALVRVEVHSPDVEVRFQDHSIRLADGTHEYQVRPGDHTLHIKSGNVEFVSVRFTLKRGHNPAVTVELANSEIVAKWGDEILARQPTVKVKGDVARQTVGGSPAPGAIDTRPPDIQGSANSAAVSPAGNPLRQVGAPESAVAPFSAAESLAHQQAWSKYLGVPIEYTNSVGMTFALIPPGEFLMGSSPAEIELALKTAGNDAGWQEQARSEGPQHRVVLTKPFYIAVQEVTQKAYQEVMGANPSHFTTTGAGKNAVVGIDTANYPVEMVSWSDAAQFCEKLSTREKLKPFYTTNGTSVVPFSGTGYRLPTEAEWEFSCRAGTTTKFWSGDTDVDLRKIAWIGKQPNKVGSMIKNSFGLYDLHGNVWEIVQDEWSSSFYAGFRATTAVDPCVMPSGNKNYVVRGGCWSNPVSCRSSARSPSGPPFRYNIIGFRVALTVDAVKQAIQNGTVNSNGSQSSGFAGNQDPSTPQVPSAIAKPQLTPLTELNVLGIAASAWVSADGLRIYWEHADPATREYEIRQAERLTPTAAFGNVRIVGKGRQPTLTSDELQMVFIQSVSNQGKRLYTSSRRKLSDAFSKAAELTEFPSNLGFNNPFLSADGLSLFVNGRSEPEITAAKYFVSRRSSLNVAWSKLEPLPIQWNAVSQRAPLTWLAMAPDELSFLATHELDVGRFRIVRFTRNSKSEFFQKYEYLSLPGMDSVYGRSPRYLAATKELYLTAPSDYTRTTTLEGWKDDHRPSLWVIRNVELSAPTKSSNSAPTSPVPTVAAKPSPAPPKQFVSVFNGKDLNGWTPMQTTGANNEIQTETAGGWLVRRGEIICVTDTPGWLRLDELYGESEIDFDFLLPPNTNSGLLVRYPGQGQLEGTAKCEIQLISTFQKKLEHNTGAIHGIVGPSRNAYKPNVWNNMSIRLQGGRITIHLNKLLIIDAKTADYAALRGLPLNGYFGLYNWRGEAKGARFRDIRVKDLRLEIK